MDFILNFPTCYPNVFAVILILLGFLLLIKGGDYLVDGAKRIAFWLNLSPMIIGMTILGFGTSMPELLVSTKAALAANSGIAIGNVVGSNIANIALILGVTAMITIVPSKMSTLKVDIPFLLVATGLFVGAAMTGTIERWHGIVGVIMLIAYVAWKIKYGDKGDVEEESEGDAELRKMPLWKAFVMVLLSFVALVYGADFLIKGASGVAMTVGTACGVDAETMNRIIGLTIVAVGTSFPELFSSVSAARKGETDMAIGNVIGSLIFNILSVIGISAAICPIQNSNVGFGIDYVWEIVLTVVLWIFLWTNHRLSRGEGVILFLSYIAFLAKTILLS